MHLDKTMRLSSDAGCHIAIVSGCFGSKYVCIYLSPHMAAEKCTPHSDSLSQPAHCHRFMQQVGWPALWRLNQLLEYTTGVYQFSCTHCISELHYWWMGPLLITNYSISYHHAQEGDTLARRWIEAAFLVVKGQLRLCEVGQKRLSGRWLAPALHSRQLTHCESYECGTLSVLFPFSTQTTACKIATTHVLSMPSSCSYSGLLK